MSTSHHDLQRRLRPLVAAAALLAAGAAQAVITEPAPGPDSGIADYGNGGNVFVVEPSLFIGGLGGAGNPSTVVGGNADLSLSTNITGWGTNLLSFDWRVHNSGAGSFGPLRMMVMVSPDGDLTTFLDRLSENWGEPPAAGDPVMREGREFPATAFDSIAARFRGNNNLTEGPQALDATCTAPGGCDAVIGMQWNAPTLGPGETFRLVVGLSDNGTALSSRWIDVAAINSPDTVLRMSGMSSIIPVPEPGSAWMLAAGLVGLGFAARRKVRA